MYDVMVHVAVSGVFGLIIAIWIIGFSCLILAIIDQIRDRGHEDDDLTSEGETLDVSISGDEDTQRLA